MYRLISVGEQWFVIPVGKEDEAIAYIHGTMEDWFAMAAGWGGAPSPRPEWMVPTEPQAIEFPSYTIPE